MKLGTLCPVILLGVEMVAARPHVLHRHRRDLVTATEWVTVNAPAEVIFVDQYGDTLSILNGAASTVAVTAASTIQTPVHVAAAPSSVPDPGGPSSQLSSSAAEQQSVAPTPPTTTTTSAQVQAVTTPSAQTPTFPQMSTSTATYVSSKPNSGPAVNGNDYSLANGMTWSPYTTRGGPCKTQEQANSDFAQMLGYDVIRIYGTDCDQTNIAMKAAITTGKKLFAGIFDLGSAASEAAVIVNAARENGNNWSIFDTISVGNEDVGSKGASVSSVQQAMSAASSVLRSGGYNGPIVHVDTVAAFIDPATSDLCNPNAAGDYLAANIHPFFDPNTDAARAGSFLLSQLQLLGPCASRNQQKRGNPRIRITETGWPKQGQSNGEAVPSDENQITALNATKQAVPADVLYFMAFNAQWQQPGEFGVEPYWGILDNPFYRT